MKKALLFDLDGTLIDTIDLILRSFQHATEALLQKKLPDKVLLQNVGQPLLTQMKAFSEEMAEELTTTYREHNIVHHDKMIKSYPKTEYVLEELKKREVGMAVITSKGRELTERGLKILTMRHYFEVVITADDTEKHKPDPQPLMLALSKLNAKPEDAYFVGDSPFDMRAGKSAGTITVAALWGAFDMSELQPEKPDFVLRDISEVLNLPGIEKGINE